MEYEKFFSFLQSFDQVTLSIILLISALILIPSFYLLKKKNNIKNNGIDENLLIIEAGHVQKQYWHDLWRFKELFLFLAWRDILVRYKQTTIGFTWALLRPFLTMLIFTIVFGKLAKLPSSDVPYPILVFAAMLPWQLFSNAISECSSSLISNANLVSKIYFPRLIVPISSVVVSLVDFLITLIILVGLMLWYKFQPTWYLLLLPLFTLLAFAVAVAGGIWFAALNIKYRDFRFIVPFVVQLGLYVSPVGFSSDLVPQEWRLLYSLNPMVGVIDGFRWAIIGNSSYIYWPGFYMSLGFVILTLITGVRYFRKTESTFADII